MLALDAASVGDHGANLAVVDLDVEDFGSGEHGEGAGIDGFLTHQGAHLQRVDHRHRWRVEAAEDDLVVDERNHLLDLRGGEEPTVDAVRLGRGHAAVELLEPGLVACDLDATAFVVHPALDVLALTLECQQRHLLVVVGREDEVRGVTCRAAGVGQRALVEEDHVGPAQCGEMPHEAVSDDAGADHDTGGLRRYFVHVLLPDGSAWADHAADN